MCPWAGCEGRQCPGVGVRTFAAARFRQVDIEVHDVAADRVADLEGAVVAELGGMGRKTDGVVVDDFLVPVVDFFAVLVVRAEGAISGEEVAVFEWSLGARARVATGRPRIATVEVPLQPVALGSGESRLVEYGKHLPTGLCPMPGSGQP